MRVLVRGAGVAGLATAWELTHRGAEVTLLERAADLTQAASWKAGGMLAPWCESESAPEIVARLGANAAEWWDAALPGQVQRCGTLVVAQPRDAGELERFARRTGGHHQWLDAEGIARLEPALAGRFRRGLCYAEEAHLDPRKALEGLVSQLKSFGVAINFGQVEVAGHFDFEIDCTGMASRRTGLRGVRGEMLLLASHEVVLTRPVRLIHPRFPLYIVPRGDGRFMVGATMIESDASGPVTARSMMELLSAAYAVHPGFGEAGVIETDAGVRPAYADNVPRVTRDGRTISVNGFFRHGFLLAPAMAQQAADMVFATTQARRLAHEAHH